MTNKEARDECIKIAAFAVSEKQKKAMLMAAKALEQEQKTGHWIKTRGENLWGLPVYECSECHAWSDGVYNYCMCCGAKMESEEQA